MQLLWTPRISRELTTIINTVAKEDIGAAERFQERVISLVTMKLENQPFLGRTGRITGTRELVVTHNYILVYRLENDTIILVSIRHTAREWAKGF